MKRLYTIGYQGAALKTFLARLQRAKVNTLVDVREFPGSRRPGFSKTALADALLTLGIEYVHKRELGAPKEIRAALRQTADYAVYFEQFNAYLRTQRDALQRLANEYAGTVVLMCYEKNHSECHRSAVAREVGKLIKKDPVHLVVEEPHGRVRKASGLHPRQGVSPA